MVNQDPCGCDQSLLMSQALVPTCVSHCMGRPKISTPALISLSLIGSQRSNHEFPALTSYASHPVRKAPPQLVVLSGTRPSPSGPQPKGPHFSAGSWNYSSKPTISSCRNQWATPISCYYKVCLPQACCFVLLLHATPVWRCMVHSVLLNQAVSIYE